MAIPKRGSRKLIVGACEYRWMVSQKKYRPGGAIAAVAAVERAGAHGSTLVITFPWRQTGDYYRDMFPDEPILPSHIIYSLNEALNLGWLPLKPGSAFNFLFPKSTASDKEAM